MSDAERDLALRITKEIAIAVVQGESDVRNSMLTKYGEYGFDLVEEFCQTLEKE